MNILFFADNFPPERNAQAARVHERSCYWVAWGGQVTVVTCAPNFPEGKLFEGYQNRWRQVETIDGIRVVRVRTFLAENSGVVKRALDYLSYLPGAIWGGLLEARPDVAVATSPHLFVALAAWLVAALRGVPFVMEVSDLWPESIAAVGAIRGHLLLRAIEWLELFLYRRAALIVVLTQRFKANLLSRGVPSAKIAVVRNGVELGRFQPQARDASLAAHYGIREDEFVVGYLGTHGLAHGLENVLEAAERLRAAPVRFLFVGSGAERERLIAAAQAKGLSNVVFAPAQPKDRMPSHWSLCGAALVHLRNAPLFETVIPSKIFEAMGMGLPVVLACPAGEASGIVVGEGVGLWVPPEDPGALAEALGLLSQDAALRARLAGASRGAAGRHSREQQARDMLSVIKTAISPRPDAAVMGRAGEPAGTV